MTPHKNSPDPPPTYLMYSSLCVLCSANCKDAAEETSVSKLMLDKSLRSSSVAM